MRRFGDLSIRHKLTALFMAISGFTALALASPMVIYDVMTFRRAVALNLAVLGDVLAGNSTAALTFRDAEAAHDVLQALRAEPNVTAACIYTTDGKPFAKYARDEKDSGFIPPVPQAKTTQFKDGRLVQFRKIVLAGETIGTLYLESDLGRLHARLRGYAFTFVLTLVVTFSMAFGLASRFQQPISRPVLSLVDTTKLCPAGATTRSGPKSSIMMSSACWQPSSTACWSKLNRATWNCSNTGRTWRNKFPTVPVSCSPPT